MFATAWAAFRASRVAQYVAGLLLAFIGWKSWLARHDRNVRDREQRRIVREIEEDTNERRSAARAAQDVVRRRYTTDELNREQLRKLRAADPHNRLGVRGLGTDNVRE